MSSQNLEWKGYAIHDTNKWDQFKVIDFQPKQPEDYDIDVKIEYCGICGSDVHTITAGWGNPMLPVIPGHEIAGRVVRVGPKVTSIKVGDRVGVGAQIGSCLKCDLCKNDDENYCPQKVDTYNSKYPNGDMAYGGYSTAIRAHEQYVFPIPDQLPLEQAAPMFCAGLTVFSPLVRNGCGPGKKVGVVGIGGLGHFAIQFARALGAEQVVAFSHSSKKKDDAKMLGATDFVETGNKNFFEDWKLKLDLIICTADVSHGIPLSDLMKTLNVHGRFIVVALPDDKLPPLDPMALASNGALFGGSHVGSKKEVLQMLDLAVSKGVKSVIEIVPMNQVDEAIRRMKKGDVRYRFVLKADL